MSYPASVAAVLTGVPRDLQRKWRKFGFLPPCPAGRHQRFDYLGLARLRVVRLLPRPGLASEELRPFVEVAATLVAGALHGRATPRFCFAWPNGAVSLGDALDEAMLDECGSAFILSPGAIASDLRTREHLLAASTSGEA